MANKRNLKKSIHKVCGDIATECIMACEVYDDLDRSKMAAIIRKTAILQDKTLRRVSVAFDKTAEAFETPHAYHTARRKYFAQAFRNLIVTFNRDVLEIVSEMNATLSPEQKAANVKALAATE